MTVWFTADLHLGHTNIIRYSGRPFVDVDAMDRALIDRWNEVVDDGDDVWLLGDFAMGKIDETLPIVGKPRGRKLLLTGQPRPLLGRPRSSCGRMDRAIPRGRLR